MNLSVTVHIVMLLSPCAWSGRIAIIPVLDTGKEPVMMHVSLCAYAYVYMVRTFGVSHPD